VARLKARSAAALKACDASDFDQLPGQIEIYATSQLASLQAARPEALTAAVKHIRRRFGPDAVRWASDTVTALRHRWSPYGVRAPPPWRSKKEARAARRNPIIMNRNPRPA
jgi:hypothetical protein